VGAYDNGEMTLDQFLKLIDIIQKDSDATKLSESYEKQQQQQNKQEVFVQSASSGGKSMKMAGAGGSEQEEDDDFDNLTQLITSDEIDST
jgi:hypothetical protein